MTTYQALLHRFHLVCDDDIADAYLREILAPLAVGHEEVQEGATEYRLTRRQGSAGLDELQVDGVPVTNARAASGPIGRLLARIDQDAEHVTGATNAVLHAAACRLNGRTWLVPGAPDAGKSTLMAYLALHGWSYLSDELVAVVPQSPPQLLAYPRTIVLDPGSWALFEELLIPHPRALTGQLPRRRHLTPPPSAIAAPDEPSAVTDVLLYRWQPGADVDVEQLDPVDALRALLGSSFSLHRRPQRDLDALATIVDAAACWRATGDSLVDVEAALRDEVDRASPAPVRKPVR